MRPAIGVMGRVPGRGGKSRLRVAREAGWIGALERAMLFDTFAAFPSGGTFFVAPSGPDTVAEALALVPETWSVVEQRGDDLGARIIHALSSLATAGDRMLVCGSDAPLLGSLPLVSALSALEEDELLLAPSADGGYVAIGAARVEEALFEAMPWSTPMVAEETRRRARALGFRLRETSVLYDIDEPADLARLARDLADDAARAPHTARLLSHDVTMRVG